MKTFETEKGNIPEGATHYFNEDHFNYFTWVAVDSFGNCWGLIEKSEVTGGIKPIPQTNIETPEEKEALDLIDTTPQQYENIASKEAEWDGKGLPPVGCKIKTKHGVSEVLSTSDWDGGVVTYSYDDGVSIGCAWNNKSWVNPIETPQQREERERLENGEAMYIQHCKNLGSDKFYWDEKNSASKEAWCKLAEQYRKESE